MNLITNNGAGAYLDVLGASTASNNFLAFRTTNTASSYNTTNTERMRITSTGNIGIGTTTPSLAKLETTGIVGSTAAIFADTSTGVSLTAGDPGIGFNTFYSSGFKSLATGYGGFISNEQAAGAITFNTAPSVTGSQTAQTMAERMRITNSGNVGIGTTSPMAALSLGSGQLVVPDGTTAAPALAFSNSPGLGIRQVGTNQIRFILSASQELVNIWPGTGGGAITIQSSGGGGTGGGLGFASASVSPGSEDLWIVRDAANTLAQRNGTNAQTFRLYNTFTDTTTYERGFLGWSSNVLQVGTERGGATAGRNLALLASSTEVMRLTTSGNVGIGTTSPADNLELSNSGVSVMRLNTNGAIGLGVYHRFTRSSVIKFNAGCRFSEVWDPACSKSWDP